MTYNLYFDYSAIMVLSLLVFFYYVTPKYNSFQNKLFGWILLANLVSCVMDILSAGILLPKYPDSIMLNRIVLMLYQFFQHSLSPLYYVYMILIIHGDKGKEKFKERLPLFIPAFAVELINISSPFTQWAFKYNENGYGRTWFYFLSWATMAFYMLLCLVIAFKKREKTHFLPKLAVVFYTLASLIAVAVQLYYPELLTINFAACITIFSMYMALLSPSLLKEALEDAERSKREAEEANAAKSNFLANMSHEIRTPMNAICGMTYLLESFDLKSDARDYIDTIQHASANLMSLINDILDYSKVDAGQMKVSETEYTIRGLTREIGGMILADGVPQNVVLSYNLDPRVPKVLKGDVTKIKTIILNLVNNAVKFTERGEVNLSIGCEEKGDGKVDIIIAVKDTGIGIDENDLKHIFDQFEQIDMAKNRKHEGTGLGLAIVKAYCELLNGGIKVSSILGVGSTFTATVEQTVIEPCDEGQTEKLKKYVYVVLDRNPYARKSMEKTFKQLGVTYSFEDEYSKASFEKFSGMNYCLIYDVEQYGAEVEAVDVSDVKGLFKLAMADLSYKIPEDCKDVHYTRKPFNVLSLLDTVATTETESVSLEDEKVFFKDTVKVAIVDDNKVNLKVTSAILKKFGINATTMLSGYEILDEIDSGAQYDLIFMDHMMPDMDGVETVKRIRAMHKGNTRTVPIVALTANTVEGVEKEYYAAGMNGALFKPVVVEDLKKTLVQWLPPSMRIDAP